MTYKQKRKAIAYQIADLHDNNCEGCSNWNKQVSSACDGCSIKDKLKHLGETLNLITSENRELKSFELVR